MNVLIIEDEPLAANRLVKIIHQVRSNVKVLSRIDSVKKSVSFLQANDEPIDLIFLDVELADGVCFEIFNQHQIKTPVIFTTAYDQYAIKAFDLNSIHYLLKPVQKDSLEQAIEKYERLGKERAQTAVDVMAIQQLLAESQNSYKKHFLGKYGNQLAHKEADQIAYFYADDNMVYMVDRDRKKYLIEYKLEDLVSECLDPKKFFRVNRKFIVNIHAVDLIKKYFNHRLQLFLNIRQEHDIVVSREKVPAFKSWLNK